MNLDELKYNVCDHCGEIHPGGKGIFERIQRPCNSNRFTYTMHVGSGFMKMFRDAIGELFEGQRKNNPLTPFYDLLDFPYLKAMPDFDTVTEFDRKCYYWCREAEIKHMKRLRPLVEAEKEFYYSY
jgi:hypothetical protein